MKKAQIKTEVEAHLQAVGFGRGTWVWQPATAELMLIVCNVIKVVKLKSSIRRRDLAFELGRIAGWAEFAGLAPKPNGRADVPPLILGTLRPATEHPAFMPG